MDRQRGSRALDVLFAFAVAAVPAGLALAVRALAPVHLADSALPWLPTAFTAVLATVAALAAVAALVPALRGGAVAGLLESGASAAIAGGAVVMLTGAGSLTPPLLASAALLATASSVGTWVIAGGPARLVGAAVAVMAVVEAVAVLTVIPATAALLVPIAPILLALAVAFAAVAAARSPGLRSVSAALLAAGAVGLLANRDGSVELLIGLAALIGGQVVACAAALVAAPDEGEERLPELAERLADAVLRFDGHLRLRDWNAAAANLLGLDNGSVGARIDDLLGVSVSDLPSGDAISVSRGRVGGLEGLATLPEPDAGDLFFDIEGDPYAFDDGIDYLFGVLDTSGEFRAFWSFDPERPDEIGLAGEKAAFEALIDFIAERRRRFPNLHVYHYASYEPSHLKRLMGRHATREAEVDELLRGGILVDLYRAVHQGLRASVESYSIKKLEPMYGFEREIDLRDAGSSIVAFEAWLELGDTERPMSDILAGIERYNRDDVVSNARLRDWLEELRLELARLTGQDVPRPAERAPEAPDSLTEAAAEVQALADRLTAGVPVDPAERTEEQHARWLLAQLLSWHRRESKATFWDFFHRIGMTPEELVDQDGAIGQLELVSISAPYLPTPKARKPRRRAVYAFPPQEHRDVNRRSELFDPRLAQEHAGESPWEAWSLNVELGPIDDERDTVELIWKAEDEIRHPEAIVALNRVPDKPLPQALLRLGSWIADHGVDADGPWRAARDLLLRRPPRCGQGTPGRLRRDGEDDLEAACRLVACLEHGTLAIQGPPGSGKTYTGSEMIVRLLMTGKRVGISATSHKVIENFLGAVLEAADRAGVEVRAVQKPGEDGSSIDDPRVSIQTDNARVRAAIASGECNVGAGTPWLWGREDFAGAVDVLFVDEAGQISLANVLAMGAATDSLVLLGDPQQLDQPLQGSHPPGADRSALAHLLGDDATMPVDRGLFLEHTWRLHPTLTAFTSAAFYEDRLESRDHLSVQSLIGPEPIRGVGPRLLPAEHTGGDNVAPDEARQVAALAATLVQSSATWIDQNGEERPIGWNDVLIVAPYNAQVGEIRRHLPGEARVGTVDKFQGQEAPISIYSMTTSTPEDAPRGMDFLYSRNRLNVATSRARCVAVVVATPALLRVRARTPQQMRLANALCRFVELAADPSVPG